MSEGNFLKAIYSNLDRNLGWIKHNVHYLVITGSQAYGTATKESDFDLYGVVIPPRRFIFPHEYGFIQGFDDDIPKFEVTQRHHITFKNKENNLDYQIYSIVKYFKLITQNNPNMIDSLFVPEQCVIHSTQIGNLIRENRSMFIHKGLWQKFKGYSFSQMRKMKTKVPTGKRKKDMEAYGMDVKFASHCVRLLLEAEQLLQTGEMDLHRDRETLMSIRLGEWSIEKIEEFFNEKEKYLENLYETSTLPYGPPKEKIKNLLIKCLEIHFGDIEKGVTSISKADEAIESIINIVNKFQ